MEFRRVNLSLQRTCTLLLLSICAQGLAQYCLSNTCLNGGTCQETLGGYTCHCPTEPKAFTGLDCSVLYNACTVFTCPNNHLCQATPGYLDYQCDCQHGFNCTKCDSDPCALPNFQCSDEDWSFTCKCRAGHSGPQCQNTVSPCSPNPCDHNAVCVENMDSYTCNCQPDYTGQHCEIVIGSCASNPCQNDAICVDKENKYFCYCVPGFQGHHCEIDINECASKPCQNNGSCHNLKDSYKCQCATGYTGVNCETEIDECQSNPCQNGATCRDHIGFFTCKCPAGYEGELCQSDIDECQSHPCQNEGVCIDAINRFHCNCSDTGFVGEMCEIDILECSSNPCMNDATCQERIKGYNCLCWAGYSGDHCELDVDECADRPCLHDGLCLERSNQSLYGTHPEFSPDFTYDGAAGYLCRCQPGFTGENCSVNIDECAYAICHNDGTCVDLINAFTCLCAPGYTGVLCTVNIDDCESNPCENGATCEDGVADYTCKCPAPTLDGVTWGGKNCSIKLEGCLNHSCQNDAVCIPYYVEEIHTYYCKCQPGFHGPHCSISTTFSFSSSGYIVYELDIYNRSKKSSEGDPTLIEVRFRTTLPNMLLLYRGNEKSYLILELFNGRLQVLFKNSNTSLFLAIDEHKVDDGHWHKTEVTLNTYLDLTLYHEGCSNGACSNKQPVHYKNDHQLQESLQKIYIGGLTQDSLLDNTQSKQNFTGCLEDLIIDFEILIPHDIGNYQSYDIVLGCNKTDWCHSNPCHHGSQCIDRWINYKCDCVRPYTGPTCIEEYTSGTFFWEDVPSFANFTITHVGDSFNISAFIRTLKPDGLVLQISNGSGDYLSIFLRSGQINIKLLSKTFTFKEYISNGKKHMINILFMEKFVQINGVKLNEELEELPSLSVSAEDTVLVGGMPPGADIEQWGGYFKGCLQDVRINSHHLDFFPSDSEDDDVHLVSVSNVTMDCVSDDMCQSSPCKNNGACTVTWNDFTCECAANFTGPTCEEPVWCQQRPCPPDSTCKDFPGGYTCLVNATFKEESLVIFTSNVSSGHQLLSVSLDFRTRDTDAVLLEASKDMDFISIAILNSQLQITLHSGNSVEGIRFVSEMLVSDALWHRVEIMMNTPTAVAPQWTISLDNGRNMVLHGNADILSFLAEDTAIKLAKHYTGCLGQVSIGGLYLPFAEQFSPQHFIRKEQVSLELGCKGADVCGKTPCQHGGECQDLFNTFSCTCAAGWEGIYCELNIDECKSNPCAHGLCYDLENGYRCNCSTGYTGINCEVNVDDCQQHHCLHGGICVDGVNSYTCQCPPSYIGEYCEWLFPPEKCGINVTCLNGGKCKSGIWGANCTCKPGFKGKRCEININDCEPNPCLNGGACQDSVNNYKCICNGSFSGVRCEKPRLIRKAEASTLLGSAIGTGMLLILLLVIAIVLVTMRKKRATQGTYSPSRQEKDGARVEMWNVLKLPPTERLI
ncbi:protein crumbs homolog 1-like isoform X2 [Hyla sarda]|uniref:protein crumbs homolog 1-like isoform X2 n=1 Tax=Hyla sarda TaxID=327740 RepID=UPI0024C3187B|nr:protein crumbs homolog 1-like isoform X2 [Hyla sarda]